MTDAQLDLLRQSIENQTGEIIAIGFGVAVLVLCSIIMTINGFRR